VGVAAQTARSLTLARGEVPVVLALRLFLPESWTSKRRGWDERVFRPSAKTHPRQHRGTLDLAGVGRRANPSVNHRARALLPSVATKPSALSRRT
jgi:hypothetical protein